MSGIADRSSSLGQVFNFINLKDTNNSSRPTLAQVPEQILPFKDHQTHSPLNRCPRCYEGTEKKLEIDFKPINGWYISEESNSGSGTKKITPIRTRLPRDQHSNSVETGTGTGTETQTQTQTQTETDPSQQSHPNPSALRSFPFSFWSTLLSQISVSILSFKSNLFFDSYVLSESSLFVYPYKIILKTCGSSPLLTILPFLLKTVPTIGLTVDFVWFARKNFSFSKSQPEPHKSFESEVLYLSKFFPNGSSFVLGKAPHACWHLFFADYSDGIPIEYDQTTELMMSGLSKKMLNLFSYPKKNKTKKFLQQKQKSSSDPVVPGDCSLHLIGEEASVAATKAGLDGLFISQDTISDSVFFSPVGFSTNTMDQQFYTTVHVTPQPCCSYASFETNFVLSDFQLPQSRTKNEAKITVAKVLEFFEPEQTIIATFADIDSHITDTIQLPDSYCIDCSHHITVGEGLYKVIFFSISRTKI